MTKPYESPLFKISEEEADRFLNALANADAPSGVLAEAFKEKHESDVVTLNKSDFFEDPDKKPLDLRKLVIDAFYAAGVPAEKEDIEAIVGIVEKDIKTLGEAAFSASELPNEIFEIIKEMYISSAEPPVVSLDPNGEGWDVANSYLLAEGEGLVSDRERQPQDAEVPFEALHQETLKRFEKIQKYEASVKEAKKKPLYRIFKVLSIGIGLILFVPSYFFGFLFSSFVKAVEWTTKTFFLPKRPEGLGRWIYPSYSHGLVKKAE